MPNSSGSPTRNHLQVKIKLQSFHLSNLQTHMKEEIQLDFIFFNFIQTMAYSMIKKNKTKDSLVHLVNHDKMCLVTVSKRPIFCGKLSLKMFLIKGCSCIFKQGCFGRSTKKCFTNNCECGNKYHQVVVTAWNHLL